MLSFIPQVQSADSLHITVIYFSTLLIVKNKGLAKSIYMWPSKSSRLCHRQGGWAGKAEEFRKHGGHLLGGSLFTISFSVPSSDFSGHPRGVNMQSSNFNLNFYTPIAILLLYVNSILKISYSSRKTEFKVRTPLQPSHL